MRQIIAINRPIQLQVFRRQRRVLLLRFPLFLFRGARLGLGNDFADWDIIDGVVLFQEVRSAVQSAEGVVEGLYRGELGIGEAEADADHAADVFVSWADRSVGVCGFGPEFGGWHKFAGEVEGAGLGARGGMAVGVEV